MLALLVGLSVQIKADEAPPKPEPKADEIKLPWTKEDMAKDWARGRAYRFDIAGSNPIKRTARIEIDAVTADGFSMDTFMKEAGKDEVAEGAKTKTFEEHLEKLLKRLKGSKQSEETVEVPFGKISCFCFTKESKGETSTTIEKYWLASSVPGMFIKAEHSVSADKQVDFESWSLANVDILRVKLPWTAKEIAAVWKDGAMFKLNVTSSAGSGWIKLTATDVTDEGFMGTEDGEMGGEAHTGKPNKMTWDSFIRQFAEAKCDTVITDETIETPAGKFECALYTTTDKRPGHEGVQKAWYVKKSPGLFAKVTAENKKGETITTETWELTEYKFGK
jgi:hypothetical protein